MPQLLESPPFWLPPILKRPGGGPRRMGLEVEFSGLELEEIAAVVIETYGGEIVPQDRYQCVVTDSSLGEFGPFAIKLDTSLLEEGKLERCLRRLGVEKPDTFSSVQDFVARTARHIVPMEIVAPPVAFNRMHELERLRTALHKRAVNDTEASVFNAFGLHLNAEVPSYEPSDLLDLLRAFVILYNWLKAKHEVNISRRMTLFIDPFPRAYVRLILAPDYAPDLDTLITDYLRYNPSRNRPLDMLPLFAFLRKELVMDKSSTRLVSARPVYHYRLPNCAINQHNWTFAREWNRWVVVERVAHDKERLHRLMRSSLEWLDHPVRVVGRRAAHRIKGWFS